MGLTITQGLRELSCSLQADYGSEEREVGLASRAGSRWSLPMTASLGFLALTRERFVCRTAGVLPRGHERSEASSGATT